MKKTLTIIFITMSALLILDSMDFSHAVAMFLLAGVVPGTSMVLNADRMLELFALLLGFVVARIGVRVTKAIMNYEAPELAEQSLEKSLV